MFRLHVFALALLGLLGCGGGSSGSSSGSTTGATGSSGTGGTSGGDSGQTCAVTGCSDGGYCDSASGACMSGCTQDAQCGTGGACDVSTHACGCASGFHDCGGTCESNDSIASCGQSCSACATKANATASCDGSQCVYVCDQGAMSCGGACASCPTHGASQTGCSGSTCVATQCRTGFELCGGACATCPTDGVTATACSGNQCVATGCASGYVACGGACVACGPADLFCCVETVDQSSGSQGGEGRYASLGVADGQVAIAYRDDTGQAVKAAELDVDSGGWNLESVTSSGDEGQGLSAAVGPDGSLHAAWYDAVALTFDYGHKPLGGTWTIETIDVTNTVLVPGRISLQLDSAGRPRVAYDVDDSLWYGERDSTGWSVIQVDSTAGTDPSLALDSTDQPHISYSVSASQSGAAFELLSYASRASNVWSTGTVVQRNGTADVIESALILDASDVPHILLYDAAFFELDEAVLGGGTWTRSALATNVLVGGLSIARDSSGALHASYIDSMANEVIYSSKETSGWAPMNVASALAPELYTSLALDASDRPYLAWWDDATVGRLQVAH